jgi:hypothetical protein
MFYAGDQVSPRDAIRIAVNILKGTAEQEQETKRPYRDVKIVIGYGGTYLNNTAPSAGKARRSLSRRPCAVFLLDKTGASPYNPMLTAPSASKQS